MGPTHQYNKLISLVLQEDFDEFRRRNDALALGEQKGYEGCMSFTGGLSATKALGDGEDENRELRRKIEDAERRQPSKTI